MNSISVVLSDLQVVSYVKAGFLALLVYDTLLEINQEYLHIWKARWTLIKCLYLWTRYTPFITTIISLVLAIQQNSSTCNTPMFTIIFSGFGIGITELILMVRTYTLYDRSKKLLVFFFLMWFSVSGVSFWAVTKWTSGGDRANPAAPLVTSPEINIASCFSYNSSGIGIGLVCYLSLLVGEAVIILLTLWKLWRRFPHQQTGLFTSLYRDGVWFYLAIPPVTIGTVIILFIAPPGLSSLADTPVLVMHSILCCRLITHAREMAAEEDRRGHIASRGITDMKLPSTDSVIDIRPGNQV